MPKDKTITNEKIIRYMKEEFLTWGYEKASLNRISAKVGITTAGLYKHFRNKADMFFFLVKETLDDFRSVTSASTKEMETAADYNPFDSDWAMFWVDFIFRHYDGVKLLICCSEGSAYENFEEDLIRAEAKANKEYADILRSLGKMSKEIPDIQWHILATAYIHLIFEIVRHDMSRDEAAEHMQFVKDLLYPGWKMIFGL